MNMASEFNLSWTFFVLALVFYFDFKCITEFSIKQITNALFKMTAYFAFLQCK